MPFLRALILLLPALWLGSASAALRPDLSHLDDLPLHAAVRARVEAAIDRVEQVKGRDPYVFAAMVPLPVNLDGGHWDRIDASTARWRTRVFSAGAQSLILDFSRFRLPQGAALWVFDAGGRTVQGPYTARNNRADGQLWTAMVPGETAVIELHVPLSEKDQVELALGQIGHGYKNARDLGQSGSCEIDVVCPLGDSWRDEIRSTVKLQIPGTLGFVTLCTGTLVNNTAQDDRPYVLTAHHCGISSGAAGGVVTYFNFDNTVCAGTPDASDTQTVSGSTLRADDTGTDMTLLELDTPPPSGYRVHYAGWDASGAGGSSGVSIHHPSGDAKKISAYTTPLVSTDVQIQLLGPTIPAWQVVWSQAATEQGSSGAGLWNQDRHLVGTLSGGSSSCTATGPGNPDYYARLDRQWQAQATASGQLKAWLDPISSGCLVAPGKDPGAAVALDCGGSGGGGTTGGGTTSGGGGGGGGAPRPDLLAVLALLGAWRVCRTRRSAHG